MTEEKKYKWKKWLTISAWSLLGVAAVVLLVSAMEKKNRRVCKGIDVDIQNTGSIMFVDKVDVVAQLKAGNVEPGTTTVESVNLRKLEERLRKNVWISEAELFFDNNDVLQVKLWEREPVARMITVSGNSFYLDSSGTFVPLSDKFSARVPVFTNFPIEKMMNHTDSLLVNDVKKMSTYILRNSFWMAQVSQVDITPGGTFEVIPTIGNHLIVFGDATDCEKKFNRLFIFYKDVLAKIGLNKYSTINVSYDQQVVAVKKDRLAIKADSTQAISMMKQLSESISKMIMDSISVNIENVPSVSIEKDSAAVYPMKPAAPVNDQPPSAKTQISPSKTVLVKTNPVKAGTHPKPKVTMNVRTDKR